MCLAKANRLVMVANNDDDRYACAIETHEELYKQFLLGLGGVCRAIRVTSKKKEVDFLLYSGVDTKAQCPMEIIQARMNTSDRIELAVVLHTKMDVSGVYKSNHVLEGNFLVACVRSALLSFCRHVLFLGGGVLQVGKWADLCMRGKCRVL